MKFIVSSSALLKQLSGINGVVTTNPVVPILENFLFEIEDSKLTITASDLQTSMITELAVEAKEDGVENADELRVDAEAEGVQVVEREGAVDTARLPPDEVMQPV